MPTNILKELMDAAASAFPDPSDVFQDFTRGMGVLEEETGARAALEAARQSSGPSDFLDRISEALTEPVVPGVSRREADMAATRYSDLASRVEKKKLEIEERKAQELEDRLTRLRGASGDDTLSFVARGNKVLSDRDISDAPFSTYSGRDQEDREIERFASMGIDPQLGKFIFDLRDRNPEAADRLTLSLVESRRGSPQDQDLSILQQAMQSKDPTLTIPLVRAMFRRLGRSEEYINELLGSE